MKVAVKRGDVLYFCKTEEQLQHFLSAGYIEVTENKAEPTTSEAVGSATKKVGRPKKSDK